MIRIYMCCLGILFICPNLQAALWCNIWRRKIGTDALIPTGSQGTENSKTVENIYHGRDSYPKSTDKPLDADSLPTASTKNWKDNVRVFMTALDALKSQANPDRLDAALFSLATLPRNYTSKGKPLRTGDIYDDLTPILVDFLRTARALENPQTQERAIHSILSFLHKQGHLRRSEESGDIENGGWGLPSRAHRLMKEMAIDYRISEDARKLLFENTPGLEGKFTSNQDLRMADSFAFSDGKGLLDMTAHERESAEAVDRILGSEHEAATRSFNNLRGNNVIPESDISIARTALLNQVNQSKSFHDFHNLTNAELSLLGLTMKKVGQSFRIENLSSGSYLFMPVKLSDYVFGRPATAREMQPQEVEEFEKFLTSTAQANYQFTGDILVERAN